VVKAASIVVDDIAKPQAPIDGQIFEGCDVKNDTVALSVILAPRLILVSPCECEGSEVVPELLMVEYAPTPSQPSTLEQIGHGGTIS
jgi:hypothetical protein